MIMSFIEGIDDVLFGKHAPTYCQWRAAVVPSQRLGNADFISELLRDSHVKLDVEDSADVEGKKAADTSFPEPYSLEMKDGTLVSFFLVRGTRTNLRELDVAQKAEKIATKIAAYMSAGSGMNHSFGMYFLHDPHTADQVFKQKIAPMLATAKRFGGNADRFAEDLRSRLVRRAAEEMTLFTVRTHMRALRPTELKIASQQYQKMITSIIASGRGIKNVPRAIYAPYGQAVLSRSQPILQRHEGMVNTLLADFNNRNVGINVTLLSVRESFERVRRFADREIPASGWLPRVFGQSGNPLPPGFENDGPAPLALGMQVLTRKIEGDIGRVETAAIGSTWYGSTVMELGPTSPRENPTATLFSSLMTKVREASIPLSISFDILPKGLEYNRANQMFNAFLGALTANNRQIRNAYKELKDYEEHRGKTDPIIGLRVACSTWAKDKESAQQALRDLNLCMQSWGSATPNAETGAPDVARISAIPEYTANSAAPILPAPLHDVVYMSPMMRPASPWDDGQLLFKTNDGVIYPVGIGTSKHASYVTGICAPSGSGKSFLTNRYHACLALSPGAQQLPYITNIDVAPSGVGFLRMLRTILPKSMHHLLVYFKVLNDESYCVNPFDLQLGCIGPTAAERDFITSVLEIVFHGLSDENDKFISAVIDEAYRMFSPTSTDAKLWQKNGMDARVAKELEEIGFHVSEDSETTVYQVVDALFKAGRIEAARIAQRYAVPRMEDLARILNSERIRGNYGTARANTDELLLDKAARAVNNAVREYKVLSGVTRKDLDNARVIVIDLQNVIGGTSESGMQFAGMMYLYARHLGARNFFLDVDEIKVVCRPEYMEYQAKRVREIQQTPKVLTYDEWHNVNRVKGLLSLNEKEARETRKFRVYLNFVTQYITDYPDGILSGMTSVFVVGQSSESQNKHAHEKLGLSETDLDILRNGLDRVGRIWTWFKLRDGYVTALLNNEVGPLETWCYTTDDKDAPLRSELETLIGESEAAMLLAEKFPTGSAAAYLDRRAKEMSTERLNGQTVTSIVAAELARSYAPVAA